MYNCLYKHLKENDILYKKQFDFQQKHSIEQSTLQLIDQANNSFEKNKFTLGIFIDLSKAFDTAEDKILISRLKNYGVRGNNSKQFKRYLNNRKHFIAYNNKYNSFERITCGVPQDSILGPLLFSIYVKNLNQASKILDQ